MHAALRSAPPVPPSPSPRPEIDVWFQTAGPSTIVKYIYISASSPIYAPPPKKTTSRGLVEGVLDVRRVAAPIHRREVQEVVGPVLFIVK